MQKSNQEKGKYTNIIKITKAEKISPNSKNSNSQTLSSKQLIIDSPIINESSKQDIFCVNDLSQIQKNLFAPSIYLWIDQNINHISNDAALKLLKNRDIDPILCESVEEAKNFLQIYQTLNQNFRIIASAKLGEQVCKQFQNNKKVAHIYIFCAYKPAGEALKNKWKKIKFYTVDVPQFLIKIEQQSKYDNKFAKLAHFMEITNKDNSYDNTIINKSRYNLYGLLLFKNRLQAKNDFIKLAKYIYSLIDKQIKDFQDQYPVEYNHPKALNWYTKQTFFYGLLNNFLRSSSNPLQTPYIRLPFEATFKAIKSIYDQGKQQKSLSVYRGGNIDESQLKLLQRNVGQYIQMFGFMSTSLKEDVAKGFIVLNNGNSLIEVVIENQTREQKIDYGYVNLSKYSEYQGQQQILFNALNVYKIMSFNKQDGIYRIKLKYGQLARIVKLGDQKVGQKEMKIILNHRHQERIINNQLKNQGDVFKYCQMYEKEIEYRKIVQNKMKETENIINANQLGKMGQVYHSKGDYNKALEYYERALKIEINVLGQSHSSTATTISNIGLVYDNKGDYNKALQYYERALKIYINVLGQSHSSTANTINNIGLVYKNKGDYNKALQYYERALKIYINVLGQSHSSTANTINNIGLVYKNKGDYNKGLQYYERALKIYINVLGQSHSSTANTINNIGLVYKNKGDYNKGLEYYERALKIYINVLGQSHSSTATTINNIGSVYDNKGDYNKALQYYERALKIYINVLGQSHSSTATTINNIGSVYDNKGDYNKALQYYERALKIYINVLGQSHSSTANTINNIGLVYKNKGDYNKGLEYYERALKIYINVLGQSHSSTATTINNIGSVYKNKGDYNKALQYYERALKIKINVLGQSHSSTATTISNIGLVYYSRKLYSQALIYFKRCYSIHLSIFGSSHQITKQTLTYINSCSVK